MTTTKKKILLSAKQKEVIKLMREGWELGASKALTRRKWLQKDGIGKGGETKDVHTATFDKLYFSNLIYAPDYSFPSQKYLLTELGKTIQL